MRPSEDTIQRLKAEHGELYELEVRGYAVLFRPPRRAEYRRFRALALDEQKRAEALERLTRDCVVWPTPEEFDALLERLPALGEVIGAKLVELAGAMEEVEIKKL